MPRASRSAVACVAALVAAPAAAQDAIPSPAQMHGRVADCLAASDSRALDAACIGRESAACMDVHENQTTLGMMTCTLNEAEAWDLELNRLWPQVREAEAQADDADRGTGGAAARGLPTRAETLLVAQRAWIAFRDAECAHAYAQGGAGSIRQLYGAACRLETTAGRTLDFRAWLRAPP